MTPEIKCHEQIATTRGGQVAIHVVCDTYELCLRKIQTHSSATVAHGGMLNWDGPRKVGSYWEAVAHGYDNKPPIKECSDEQGEYGIENAPLVYGETR